VRDECLAYALAAGCNEGVWGGRSEGERRLQRRALGMHAPHRHSTQLMYASGCRCLDCQQWHSDELVRKSERRRRCTDIGP
jgi:Transcription factor WhiB